MLVTFLIFYNFVSYTKFWWFFSVEGKTCLHNCSCRYSAEDKANVFTCQNKNFTVIPQTIQNGTDWMVLSENNLGYTTRIPSNLNQISRIDLYANSITGFSENAMTALLNNTKYLNIASNKINKLPKLIKDAKNFTELWISNNSYECNCDMMWMKDWLVKAKNVMDKESVVCANAKMKGSLPHVN